MIDCCAVPGFEKHQYQYYPPRIYLAFSGFPRTHRAVTKGRRRIRVRRDRGVPHQPRRGLGKKRAVSALQDFLFYFSKEGGELCRPVGYFVTAGENVVGHTCMYDTVVMPVSSHTTFVLICFLVSRGCATRAYTRACAV